MTTLDPDRPLTADQRRQIRREMKEQRLARKLSMRDMGRLLRCSAAVYSKLERDVYPGDCDKYLQNAAEWLARKAEESAPATGYVETSITRSIMTICSRAVSRPTIGKIIAPSGVGKTMALQEFARQRGDRALYLYAGQCISGRVALVKELAAELCGPIAAACVAADAWRHVRQRLAEFYAGGNGAPFCILVDEATTLNAAAKNTLRNLHDDPRCRVAIVLADTARLDMDLSSRSERAQYEQLQSRCRAVWTLSVNDEIPDIDVDRVTDEVLDAVGFNGRLLISSRRYLHTLAQADGKLRNVANRIQDVADLAEAAGVAATYSATELDYAAPLSGGAWTLEHTEAPFGRRADAARPLRRTG